MISLYTSGIMNDKKTKSPLENSFYRCSSILSEKKKEKEKESLSTFELFIKEKIKYKL